MLQEDGYEVDLAADATRAAERLALTPAPDVLITELHAPPSGGARLVQIARARYPRLPVLVVTSHPNLATSLERELDPPATVLTKPLAYDELRELLARMTPGPSDSNRMHGS